VFGDERFPILPDALIPASEAAEAKDHAHRGIGRLNVLKVGDFSRGAGAWDSDIRTPTRLGEPSIIVRLARWQDGVLSPWRDDPDPYRAWRMSELTLRVSQFQAAIHPDEACGRAIETTQASWPGRFDPPPILALVKTESAKTWRGALLGSRQRVQEVAYTTDQGMALIT